MTQVDTPQQSQITFVGHATTLVELSGVRILTDPVLRHRFRFLKRHSDVAAVSMDLDNVDVVVLSHMHFDHMDYPSLRMVPRHVPIVTPAGGADYLHKRIPHDIVEMREGESLTFGGVDVCAAPAQHDSNCYWPFWLPKSVLSYMFVGEQTVYFVGDSALFDGMEELGKQFDIDAALLPIWGYGPYLRGDHMDPSDAARALGLLKPRIAVPIHWGTLHPVGPWWKRMSYLWRPAHLFSLEATRFAPRTDVRVLEPGAMTCVTDQKPARETAQPVPSLEPVLV